MTEKSNYVGQMFHGKLVEIGFEEILHTISVDMDCRPAERYGEITKITWITIDHKDLAAGDMEEEEIKNMLEVILCISDATDLAKKYYQTIDNATY